VVLAGLALASSAGAAAPPPVLVHDVQTGMDRLGTVPLPSPDPANPSDAVDPIQDYTQPDTQVEPSIAVNPANPRNVVTAYQEGRIADGGDATNGFATSFDGGLTWLYGELPGLTGYPGQGGEFERASDAVVAFGPDNVVYANSLVFDLHKGGGTRSGIAINVSKDGGRTWSKPVVFQDDRLGGTNDKNWIVVDNGSGTGHHKGRVYAVWDRVAPVVYDYCDHDCDQLGNWLPDFQVIDPVVFPAQGIGAYPMVLKSGALGMVIDTTTIGAPTGQDEPEPSAASNHVMIVAPAAGSTPYPAPLAFAPPIQISQNRSAGITAQRASDGLPAAAVDPRSGAVYAVWDDGRFRTDGKNDAVIAKSTDEGRTWSAPVRINGGPKDDKANHYGVGVAVSEDGVVHVSWRQRDESGKPPLFTDAIDTYYSESRDGAKTWTDPIKIDVQPSLPWFGAFSRDGTFEGDYDQLASAGGYTYVARDQGAQLESGEAQALVANPDPQAAGTVVLTAQGKGHQHQRNWVALVQNAVAETVGAAGPASGSVATLPSRRSCASRRVFSIRLHDPRGRERLVSAQVFVNGRRVAVRRGKGLRSRVDLRGLPLGRFTVRIVARTDRHRTLRAARRYRTCVAKPKR
jgi:hypothetical protein